MKILPYLMLLTLLVQPLPLMAEGSQTTLRGGQKFFSLKSAKVIRLQQGKIQPRFISLQGHKPSYRAIKMDHGKPELIQPTVNMAEQSARRWPPRRFMEKQPTKIRHTWPVEESAEQRLSSPYGYRQHPITGKRAFHAGIDIAAATGTDVLASADGIVEETGTHPRLGRFVKIRHADDSYSLYGHLSAISVKKGMEVEQKDKVAEIGSTGRSTGPHLDYSLRIDGKPIDPLPILAPRGTTAYAFLDRK